MDITMSMVVMQVLHGLTFGMLLFLVSSGLTLVFGMMDVLNFAHASFYMLGAYFSYELVTIIGNFWVALAVCPILVGILGIMMERFLLRRVHAGGHVLELALTFGLSFIVIEVVKWIWGLDPLPVAMPEMLVGSTTILGSEYPLYRLFIIILTFLIIGFMALILTRTQLGLIVRAAVSDRDMVSALGINTPLVFMVVMGIGAALAGVAGVIAGPFLTTYPGMAAEISLYCFVVVVTGGLGSLLGAVAVSFILGQMTSFGVLFAPRYAIVFPYLLMALVLIVRPSGLFGEKQ